MCGLVGVFGNLYQRDLTFFKQALICDVFRGPDSVGIATLSNAGAVDVIKKLMNPMDFLDLKSVDKLLGVSKKGVIGHNRKSTMGGITQDNAHPFTHGRITLAHNGTLSNKFSLQRDMLKSGSFETDSELICFLLDSFEVDEVIPELEGAFALTWFDSKDETLNIIRNTERELNVALVDNKIYWASERKMLEWLLTRGGTPLVRDLSKITIVEPAPGVHLKFRYDKNKVVCKSRQLEVAPPVKKPKGGYRNGGINHHPQRYKGSNISQLNPRNQIGNPPDEKKGKLPAPMVKYNELHGTDYRDGSVLYGYYQSKQLNSYTGKGKGLRNVNVTFTLAAVPYNAVKVYCIPDNNLLFNDKEGNPCRGTFRLNLQSVYKNEDGDWEFVARRDAVIPVMAKQMEEQMENWSDNHSAEFPKKEKKASEIVDTVQEPDGSFAVSMHEGYQGEKLPWSKFKEVCKKGCAICSDPIDASVEAVDRDCHFISHSDAVCGYCANDKTNLKAYGFDAPKSKTH